MDFPANAPVSAVRDSIDKHGVALLRGAVAPEIASLYLTAVDGMGSANISAEDFKRCTGMTIDDYFATRPLSLLIGKLLKKPYPDLQSVLTVTGSNGFIPMHTDGIIQGTQKAVVALWAPLHRCGRDAPGLRVVPAPRQEVMRYLRRRFPERKIPGWCSLTEWESTGAFVDAALRDAFGPDWCPEMNPGDVLVFTNWTIHGSGQGPGKRTAIVQRWVADRWGGWRNVFMIR